MVIFTDRETNVVATGSLIIQPNASGTTSIIKLCYFDSYAGIQK